MPPSSTSLVGLLGCSWTEPSIKGARIEEVEETRADASSLFDTVAINANIEAKSQGVALKTHVVVGHAVPAIAGFVERGGYDLLIVGFMGHSALYNRMIGSTTDRLVEIAPCKVMVAN